MRIKSFDEWLAGEQWAERRRALQLRKEVKKHGRCDQCGVEDVDLVVDAHCLACAKYGFGYDQAEEAIGFGIIRGAVRTALEQGVRRETVLTAVMDALDPESDWCPPHSYGREAV